MKNHFGLGNILVIVITIILFIAALFMKGFTKDLLLEAGVLLVSIKIILMNYQNSLSNKEVLKVLDEIKQKLQDMNNKP